MVRKLKINESINTMKDKVYDNVALLGYACTLAQNDLHHIHLNAVGDKFQEIHLDAEMYMGKVSELNDFCLELAKEGGLSLYNETYAFDVIKDSGNDWKVEEADTYEFKEAYTSMSNILSDLAEFIKIITEMAGVTSDVTSTLDEYLRDFTKAVNYFIAKKLNSDGDIITSKNESTRKCKRVKKTVGESLTGYEDCSWIDEQGVMGEPDEIWTFQELKKCWDNLHNEDPCMDHYNNFEDWFYDTIEFLKEI